MRLFPLVWMVSSMLIFAVAPGALALENGKLKIFILAVQSNLEGHAKVETFDYIGDDPATAPLLAKMRGADGKPRVSEGAWISYFTGRGDENGEGFGKLTAGYELAGFVWLQGFNDMVTRDVYPELPEGRSGNRFGKYSEWLGDLIRDVRKDLNAPEMPFVIGVMGVGGLSNEGQRDFREAMAAPAGEAEFRGNVAAVETAPFWNNELGEVAKKREEVGNQWRTLSKKVEAGEMTRKESDEEIAKFEAELISEEEALKWERGASNQAYHYLGCAKTFALMGEAFAEAVLDCHCGD